MIKKELTVGLTPDLQAIYILSRDGQDYPANSDKVRVKAKVCLPCGEDLSLPPKLRFGYRTQIGGERLHCHWGTPLEDRHVRSRDENFLAPTWAEAFAQAEDWALGELKKLQDALKTRAQALADAE